MFRPGARLRAALRISWRERAVLRASVAERAVEQSAGGRGWVTYTCTGEPRAHARGDQHCRVHGCGRDLPVERLACVGLVRWF